MTVVDISTGPSSVEDLNSSLVRKDKDTGQSIKEMLNKFYTWPHSFEYEEYLCDSLRKEIRKKYSTKSEDQIEQKVSLLLKSAKLYQNQTQYAEYLDKKAEFRVVDEVRKFMTGRPGLLLRGKQLHREDFDKLKQVLGEFVPNCRRKPQCKEGNHQNQCFNMETDITLIYPGEDKLHVRLGEEAW